MLRVLRQFDFEDGRTRCFGDPGRNWMGSGRLTGTAGRQGSKAVGQLRDFIAGVVTADDVFDSVVDGGAVILVAGDGDVFGNISGFRLPGQQSW